MWFTCTLLGTDSESPTLPLLPPISCRPGSFDTSWSCWMCMLQWSLQLATWMSQSMGIYRNILCSSEP